MPVQVWVGAFLAVVAALLGALTYRALWRAAGRGAHPGRTVSMAVGSAVLAVGWAPLWGDGFSGHVAAHLLLGMLGPLLVVLADPLGALLAAAAPPMRRTALRWLHHPVVVTVSRPTVAWVLAVLTPWLLWLTPFYRVTEDVALLHGLVHLHFVLSGILFTSVVLGVGPLGRRVPPAAGMLALVVTLPTHALLGLVVLSMREPDLGVASGGLDALADQRRGAVLMWLAGDLIATVMLAAAFPRWLAWERRRARREDDWLRTRATGTG